VNANEKDALIATAAAYVKNLEQYLGFLDRQVADKADAAAELAIQRARLTSAEPFVAALVAEREAIIAASTTQEDGIFPGETVPVVAIAQENSKALGAINGKLARFEQETQRVAELESRAAQWVGFGNLAFKDVPEVEARELIGAMLKSRRAVLEALKAAE